RRRRRRKKEEKVGSAKGRKKTPPEEYLDFKPPESPGFRIGVHMGRLWENYLVLERHKQMAYARKPFGAWFWRTYDQQEIDYVEERDGGLFGYEFKWSPTTKARIPKIWIETYAPRATGIITPDNVGEFLLSPP
ncbi:MAG: DUF4143 domain-containing protein, partial [Limisphaerales bacterium]